MDHILTMQITMAVSGVAGLVLIFWLFSIKGNSGPKDHWDKDRD
jgi:hypothetical protein